MRATDVEPVDRVVAAVAEDVVEHPGEQPGVHQVPADLDRLVSSSVAGHGTSAGALVWNIATSCSKTSSSLIVPAMTASASARWAPSTHSRSVGSDGGWTSP